MADAPQISPPRSGGSRGFWSLRVERLFFLAGVGLQLVIGAGWLAVEGAALTWDAALGLLVLSLIGGWGLARWFGGRTRPPSTIGWLPTLVGSLFILVPILGFIFAISAPTMVWLGGAERLMLAPALCALIMVGAGGLRLHPYVARAAALLVGVSLFVSDDVGDFPSERVAIATAAQLQESRRSGDTVVVRGTSHDQGERLFGIAPRRGEDCQTVRFVDRRRTLLGLDGRRLSIRFQACWSGGEPSSLVVVSHGEEGNERGGVRAIRLLPVDAFSRGQDRFAGTRGGDTDLRPEGKGLRYGDRAADLSPDGPPGFVQGGLRVADRRGRPRSDGGPDNDTVLARVGERGNLIEVALGFESSDLLWRERSPSDVVDGNPDRPAGTIAPRGLVRDVVMARLYRAGGSSAELERIGGTPAGY